MPRKALSVSSKKLKKVEADKTLQGEIRLRRLQPEEAMARLESYLHQAFIYGLDSVKIIHGKGTDTLRDVVRVELATHPLVRSVRGGYLEEGGEGVTIIELEAL